MLRHLREHWFLLSFPEECWFFVLPAWLINGRLLWIDGGLVLCSFVPTRGKLEMSSSPFEVGRTYSQNSLSHASRAGGTWLWTWLGWVERSVTPGLFQGQASSLRWKVGMLIRWKQSSTLWQGSNPTSSSPIWLLASVPLLYRCKSYLGSSRRSWINRFMGIPHLGFWNSLSAELFPLLGPLTDSDHGTAPSHDFFLFSSAGPQCPAWILTLGCD